MIDQLRRIAVDLTPLLPGGDNGGIKILALELVRELARIRPDTQFFLLTSPRSHDELAALEAENVSRKIVGSEGRWRNYAWQPGGWLRRVLVRNMPGLFRPIVYEFQRITTNTGRRPPSAEKLNVDLLFCPFGGGAGHSELRPEIPVVAIVIDLQHKAYPQFFTQDQITERDRNLNSHRTSFVAVISDFVRQSLLDEGFPQASVKTIYIRMDRRLPELNPEHASSILQQLKLIPELYFLYPANFWRHKNHEMLFTGFLQARSLGLPSQIKLVCTGAPGPRVEELADATHRLGLGGAVLFPGFLDEVSFSAVLRSSLGVVFPSLYEGFGMPVLEAMASECPVACSDRSSLVEIAEDAALLFDPRKPSDVARAMCRLACDGELRADLIGRGKRRAAEFADTDRMAREYWELFHIAAGHYRESAYAHGIYADGWAGPRIILQYGAGREKRSIFLEVEAPKWTPVRQFDLDLGLEPTGKPRRCSVLRGTTQRIECEISSNRGAIDISIKPQFQPLELKFGSDARQLTLKVLSLEICERGRSSPIYPIAMKQ